jgi:hypothetical protein
MPTYISLLRRVYLSPSLGKVEMNPPVINAVTHPEQPQFLILLQFGGIDGMPSGINPMVVQLVSFLMTV